MVPAWYFCASMKADAGQASAWLAVLDTLDTRDNDNRLAIAYARLAESDVWQQAYALPYVLRALREWGGGSTATRKGQVFVADLIESLPDDLAPPFRELAAAFFGAREMQQVLEAAFATLKPINSMPTREPSLRPYLDLQRFLPEAILLAFLGEIARRGARDLGAKETEDPFATFTDQALAHTFGRLPFLLAIDLELERKRISPGQLEQLIWSAPRSDPQNEPDLLDADARVLWAQHAQEPGRTIDLLIDESILLGRLRDHLVNQERRKTRSIKAPLDLAPLVQSDLGRFVLPVVAWQLALWQLAVNLDPGAAMRRLSALWGWEPAAPAPNIDSRGPFGRTADVWRRLAKPLLELRGRNLEIRTMEAKQISLRPAASWALFSPWIPLDGSRCPTQSDLQRYPRPINEAQLIRLFGTATLAVRLLRTVPDEAEFKGDFREPTVPGLLVHAVDVLAMYGRHLHGQEEPDLSKRLTEPIAILALICERQCKHAGEGHWERIGPERFTRIFDIARDLRRLAPDVQVFVDEVMPRTLMKFMADGYNTAIDEFGSSRWWPHLLSIYELYRRPLLPGTFHDLRTLLQSTLVVRFLGRDNGGESVSLPQLDWTRTEKHKGWRGVQPRQLLLGRRRPADTWLRPAWPEPGVDGKGATTRLFRGVERLAALSDPGHLPTDVQQEWKEEIANALDSIARPHELDRFLRMRLLEVLDLPVLAGDAQGQLRIALLLLEYGSPWDQQQLLSKLFPPSYHNWIGTVPDARHAVRARFLRALLGVLARPPARASGVSDVNRDPIDLDVEGQHRVSLIESVRRIAERVNPPRNFGDEELLDALRRQVSREVARESEMARLVPAEVQVLDRRERLVLGEGMGYSGWHVSLAVRDPNLPRAAVMLEKPTLENCRNLFELTATELAELSPTRLAAIEVLGVVVGERWPGEYVLNCGLNEYIFARSDILNLTPGASVSVHLRAAGDHRRVWRHDERLPLIPLRSRWPTGMRRRVEVRSEQEKNGVSVHVQGAEAFRVSDWGTDWDSDPSRRFAADGASTIAGFVHFEDGRWLPVDRNFDELLVAEWTEPEGQLAVLCFLGRGPNGEGFRFQRCPGENYLLADDDFTDAARIQIEEQVRQPGSRGLLVTVTLAPIDDYVRPTLARVGTTLSDQRAVRRYAALRCPFDHRNLEWRSLPSLSGGEPALAEKNGGWSIAVDPRIPGFPDSIDVKWSKHWPSRDEDQAMATVLAWGSAEQFAAQVRAEAVYVLRVNYCGETSDRFYDRWISLREGDRLRLKEVLGHLNQDGQFLARTEQGLRVYVEGESLTLRFIRDDFRLSALRECEIARIRPWTPLGLPASLEEKLLPDALRHVSEARGIFVRVPHVRARKRLCTILWKVGTEYFEHEVLLEKLPDRLEQGMVAHLARTASGELQLAVESRGLVARGLWTLHDGEGVTEEAAYLGRGSFGPDSLNIAERRAGELLHLRAVRPEWHHLAISDGASFKGGLDPSHPSSVTSNGGSAFIWRARDRQLRRAHLEFQQGVLVGTCYADSPQVRVVPQRVILTVQRVPELSGDSEPLYRIQRRFELLEHRTAPLSGGRGGRLKEKSSVAETHQAVLDAYFAAKQPKPLEAILRTTASDEGDTILQAEIKSQGGNSYMFPVGGNRWVPRIGLGSNESPWIGGANYEPENCCVILKRTDLGFVASFKEVPPRGLADFRAEVASDTPLGERVSLRFRLYYVGRERPAGTAGDQNLWWHRFEWGYGHTLFLPEHALQWNGGDFSRAGLVLFHGDSIGTVRFASAASALLSETTESDGEAGPAATDFVLSIESIHVQFSDARTLYDQRRRYKIVHLVRVSQRTGADGKITHAVNHVLGFDARAPVDGDRKFLLGWQSQLTDFDGLGDLSDQAYVLARLDERAYEDSLGRSLLFRRVEMELSGSKRGGLDPGELVFMEAGGTEPKPNDIGLRLRPIEGFVGRLGPELRDLLLLRRNFSCRQDLLGRIHDAGLTTEVLTGRLLLVKLSMDGARAAADLVERMPPRQRTVLGQGVGRGRMLFATVAEFLPDAIEPELLRLELRPGVFVEIPIAVTDFQRTVLPGDIVRIEVNGTRYRVSPAASGDNSFVPRQGRPAVALPKNRLLRKKLLDEGAYFNDGFWIGRSYFSVGGLPNVETIAGGWDSRDRRWRSLIASDAIRLMETPHPRLGTLMRDENDERRTWLWPRVENAAGGRLAIDTATRQLFLQPIAAPFDEAAPPALAIPWTLASFADESIAEIRSRIERHQFGYHDVHSGHWLRRDELGASASDRSPAHRLRAYELSPHSPLTGPIFAELIGDAASLRYSSDNFIRFGFPVAELFAAFGEKRRRMSFTVAGVVEQGGLWLEIAPGRVAEMPAQLVVRRLGNAERSLADLHWPAFAPGDRVELWLASSDPLTIDRLALVDWNPGVRGSFGQSTAILPVDQPNDAEAGVLVAGANASKMRLAFADDCSPERIALRPDNTFNPVERWPVRGETVLLVIGDSGRPSIAGYPELRPLPDRMVEAGFASDPIGKLLMGTEPLLVRAIKAAGGAIPVTVGALVPSHGVLRFHREHQIPGCQIPPGKLGRARVLGRIDQCLVLRWGGGLLLADIGDVVSGAPSLFHAAVSETLRDSRTEIWFRRLIDGRIVYRAEVDEPMHEIVAVMAAAVEGIASDGTSACGLVCRDATSGAMYWLPAAQAGWTDLSRDELIHIFGHAPFPAQIIRSTRDQTSPILSVVRVQTVQREFRGLKMGTQLSVHVERRRQRSSDDPPAYLVTTTSSRIALSLEASIEESWLGTEIKVEVLRREERPPRLDVVLPGHKTFYLDLPQAILQEIAQPDSVRAAFEASGLAVDGRDLQLPVLDSRGVSGKSPEELDPLLAAVYWHAEGRDQLAADALPLCSAVALAWLRARRRDRDLSVAHALMALLLLDRVSAGGGNRTLAESRFPEPRERDVTAVLSRAFQVDVHDAAVLRDQHLQTAVDFALNVGLRAVRSRHIELLASAWLFYEEPTHLRRRARQDDLWGRMRQIADLMSGNVTAEALERLRNMCTAIELRDLTNDLRTSGSNTEFGEVWQNGLPAVAAALRASIGEARGVSLLVSGAPIMTQLAAMLRTLPVRNNGTRAQLDRRHLAEIPSIISTIQSRGWNLYFLEPLPQPVTESGAMVTASRIPLSRS